MFRSFKSKYEKKNHEKLLRCGIKKTLLSVIEQNTLLSWFDNVGWDFYCISYLSKIENVKKELQYLFLNKRNHVGKRRVVILLIPSSKIQRSTTR